MINDEAYRAFQSELQANSEKGDLIQGANGVRKVRLRLPGRGKSSGARVMIYLYLESHAVIDLLTLYTKKEQADLTSEQKKATGTIVDRIKCAYRGRI